MQYSGFYFCSEFIDFLTSSKSSRQEDIDVGQLIELLKMKDEEYQETLKIGKMNKAHHCRFAL